MTAEIRHRVIPANGIEMHLAEAGDGPLVLMCHGWPELWYSWRHQLMALAEAGFHAVAPDMRGFGQTSAPDDVGAYTILHNVGDMVALVAALGEKQAIIVGHDWGAPVAWTAAMMRPDLFPAVVAMSVPHRPRSAAAPLQTLKDAGLGNYYWIYFQKPGVAEAEFERDPAVTLRKRRGSAPSARYNETACSGERHSSGPMTAPVAVRRETAAAIAAQGSALPNGASLPAAKATPALRKAPPR